MAVLTGFRDAVQIILSDQLLCQSNSSDVCGCLRVTARRVSAHAIMDRLEKSLLGQQRQDAQVGDTEVFDAEDTVVAVHAGIFVSRPTHLHGSRHVPAAIEVFAAVFL